MIEEPAIVRWRRLVRFVNDQPVVGDPGVRDTESRCEFFDGQGYDGSGDCLSDGHYLCAECSLLSPEAPRFTEHGREGRGDRLRLFWARTRRGAA